MSSATISTANDVAAIDIPFDNRTYIPTTLIFLNFHIASFPTAPSKLAGLLMLSILLAEYAPTLPIMLALQLLLLQICLLAFLCCCLS